MKTSEGQDARLRGADYLELSVNVKGALRALRSDGKRKEGMEEDGMSSNPRLKVLQSTGDYPSIQGEKKSPNYSCNSSKGHKAKGAKLTEQV